jgi:starch synthase
MGDEMNILFLSPEVAPFAKTGGLADVAGSLPSALVRQGAVVLVVLPLYRLIREKDLDLRPLDIKLGVRLGAQDLGVNVYETEVEDRLKVCFLEREDMFDRPNLYGNAAGDYYDNLERFSLYAHAALKLAEALLFRPRVIHCHDWQTGLVPPLVKGPYGSSEMVGRVPTVFTIHNIGYQGLFPNEKLGVTSLSRADFYQAEGLEYWGNISLLKAGIVYASAVTTVSPGYSREIQSREYGRGMEGILSNRKKDLHGILNGVDYGVWDPAIDRLIPCNYSPRHMSGKRRCKQSLMEEMGIAPSFREKPVLAMISRLDAQKGLDLLLEILDRLLEMEVAMVVLGTGEEAIQQGLKHAATRHPGKIGIEIGFNEGLAHRIMAGADLFLIPSRYEPCGLTQMYALKYGTVPVVRATGGLDDTIVAFDPQTGEGNGFKFSEYAAGPFLREIEAALALYENKGLWDRLTANGMRADFSWDRSARLYLDLFRAISAEAQDRLLA